MRFRTGIATTSGRGPRVTVILVVGVLATTLVACSSTATQGPSSSSTKSTIPPATLRGTTGLTPTTVRIGNISTLFGGLFKGAPVGVQAYADYINSMGGVNGRKIVVDGADDGYNNGANNKALTQQDITRDFAMVGSFSLNDAFGGTVLAADPSVPNVSVALDGANNNLPNTFSPSPASGGWQLGPLVYFQKKYPNDVLHAGALIANQASAITKWNGEKAAMQHLGYHVAYDPTFDITQTDFTQYVIAMRNAGVKILFVEQMPENYASAVFKALAQQNFHPVVVLGASTYSQALVPASGGRRQPTARIWSKAPPSTSGRTQLPSRRTANSCRRCKNRRRVSSRTCSPCTAGSPPSSLCRHCGRPGPIRPGVRYCRRFGRSRPSPAAT